MSNRTPLGMASGEWKFVKEVQGDLGYADLLRQGIENGSSSLSLARSNEVIDRFVKTDDVHFTTTSTAAFNPVYGREVYVQTNMDTPFMGALAKQPWTKSGIRVKIANSSTLVTGLGETDALPYSTAPTYALWKFGFKQCVTRADWTSKMQRMSNSGDDAIPAPNQLLKDKAEEHALGLDQALLANAETAAAAAAANYSGVSLFESIDRIISCSAEEADLGGTHAYMFNPWMDAMTTINRDGATTYDSVVVHGDGTNCYQTGNPNFAVDASLTLEAKDTLLYQCLKNGLKKSNAFWLTGFDTYKRLKQLYEVKETIMNPVNVTYSVNGVSVTGTDVGFPQLASMDDIPMVIDPNCPKDTIDKLFLIDGSNVYLSLATPTVAIDLGFPAFSTITSSAQRLAYGKVLLTEGELCATRLNTSGKLCALKA